MGVDRLLNKKKIQKNEKNENEKISFQNENENNENIKSVHNLNGISYSLSRIPKDLCLSAADKRTVCSLVDILGFLEQCRGSLPGLGPDGPSPLSPPKWNKNDDSEDNIYDDDDNGHNDDYYDNNSKYNDDYSKYDVDYKESIDKNDIYVTKTRIPVGIALLQSLFADAINDKKYKQGSRIIR
jgi:hypothetical protein